MKYLLRKYFRINLFFRHQIFSSHLQTMHGTAIVQQCSTIIICRLNEVVDVSVHITKYSREIEVYMCCRHVIDYHLYSKVQITTNNIHRKLIFSKRYLSKNALIINCILVNHIHNIYIRY